MFLTHAVTHSQNTNSYLLYKHGDPLTVTSRVGAGVPNSLQVPKRGSSCPGPPKKRSIRAYLNPGPGAGGFDSAPLVCFLQFFKTGAENKCVSTFIVVLVHCCLSWISKKGECCDLTSTNLRSKFQTVFPLL